MTDDEDNANEKSFGERVREEQMKLRRGEAADSDGRLCLDHRDVMTYTIPGFVVLMLPDAWFASWEWLKPWLAAAYILWAFHWLLSPHFGGWRLWLVLAALPLAILPAVGVFMWVKTIPYAESALIFPALFATFGFGAYASWINWMGRRRDPGLESGD